MAAAVAGVRVAAQVKEGRRGEICKMFRRPRLKAKATSPENRYVGGGREANFAGRDQKEWMEV